MLHRFPATIPSVVLLLSYSTGIGESVLTSSLRSGIGLFANKPSGFWLLNKFRARCATGGGIIVLFVSFLLAFAILIQ